MFNDTLWFYIIHVQVYSITCTYQHVVEFEVLHSNQMFNDTLWFYIIHVQVYSITCTYKQVVDFEVLPTNPTLVELQIQQHVDKCR
jgi:hypothetical protein